MTDLPVISCDGCGACCSHMVMPPFVPFFDRTEHLLWNEEFDAFRRDWPGLHAELVAEYERMDREGDWPEERACFWLDPATRRCRNYEARPGICREFEMGGEDCLGHRRRAAI